MSLAPLVHPDIRGVEGKPHPVATLCAAPGCISVSQQAHHLWPRSFLRGQPYDWVSLPSGRVVANTIGLCMRHHGWVTGGIGGHKAQIHLEPDETFVWLEVGIPGTGSEWVNHGAIHPQPFSETPGPKPKPPAHHHPDLEEGETCKSCGYTRPPKREPGPKRPTKSYTLLVPDDAEIGADVLDEWVEQLAVILGFGDDVSKRLVRYHTIVAGLAFVMINRQQFLEEIAEVKT